MPYYDNSSKNPNNPFTPPRPVTYGEQTFNEMCFVFLGGTGKAKAREMLLPYRPRNTVATKAVSARIDETKKEARPLLVPFKLTDTQHVMVRVKINGKGPFNFIVDTGAPIIFVATAVGKQVGLDTEAKGLTMLDKLEFEGGGNAYQSEVPGVETPFQLEGMNGMGLAGVELHGILGYTVLAKFRMEFDFTKDTLRLDTPRLAAAASATDQRQRQPGRTGNPWQPHEVSRSAHGAWTSGAAGDTWLSRHRACRQGRRRHDSKGARLKAPPPGPESRQAIAFSKSTAKP